MSDPILLAAIDHHSACTTNLATAIEASGDASLVFLFDAFLASLLEVNTQMASKAQTMAATMN